MNSIFPDSELVVVSEFPPPTGRWIPYHVGRGFSDNFAFCKSKLRGEKVQLAAIILEPRVPFWRMRLMGLLIAPWRLLVFNENLDHFMLRPSGLPTMFRHFLWRSKNFVRWQLSPSGHLYHAFWMLAHPSELRHPLLRWSALFAGSIVKLQKHFLSPARVIEKNESLSPGISVVIPSRNGRDLLARLLPGLVEQLGPGEIIVVDNGSDDHTAEWLQAEYPQVIVETSDAPLSFARAVNRGIHRALYSHVCLLNNDMVLELAFFHSLQQAFDRVPELFCATAQIFLPAGQRREETGKAIMPDKPPKGFPVECDLPVPGEDLSYVLYGSGGCSLFSTTKLRALGSVGEMFEPAYVEDLDLGVRAWQRGWSTVFVAAARVLHLHRATTSRYFSDEELHRVLEVNYLRFLARSVASPQVFARLWRNAIHRLAADGWTNDSALKALSGAWRAPRWVEAPTGVTTDFLALTNGNVAVFSGRQLAGATRVLIASPYLPFPLSHGGAVRIYNLMRRAAAGFSLILVAFVDEFQVVPAELLDICAEVVLVRRLGSHARPATTRPDTVEEFDSPAYRAAIRQTIRKWEPQIAQLEFTQMAQYAADCAPAKTLLVEHDITYDLFAQMLSRADDWEVSHQHRRWVRFETRAWAQVDAVITMSEQDRQVVHGAPAFCLPNGVDVERFHPSEVPCQPNRILFIGSFAHLPNVLAMEFFLREVWPRLTSVHPVLHIIAGLRHQYFLERYRDRATLNLAQDGIELQDFVSDVRPAYEQAAVVIAPLLASAGTNIKIMEAMAMGKAIVTTDGGIHGLDLLSGHDVLVANTGEEQAAAIEKLLSDPSFRKRIGQQARQTAIAKYDWDSIATEQRGLYRRFAGS